MLVQGKELQDRLALEGGVGIGAETEGGPGILLLSVCGVCVCWGV